MKAGRSWPVLLLATLLGCAPLPPQGSIGVTTGPLSDQWQAQWDPELRIPTRMINRSLQEEPQAGVAVSDSAAEAAVRAVFREYHDWFRWRPGLDDFRIANSYARGWLRFLRIVQTYRGVPVAGQGYDVRVMASGRVGSFEGRIQPDLQLDVTPVLSSDQAESRARGVFDVSGTAPASLARFQFEYESGFRDPRVLVLLPKDGRHTLAWGVIVRRPPYGTWRVYVDATQGTVLGYQTLAESFTR